MTWTSPALLEYLYGVAHDFVFDNKGQLVITPIKIETHEHEGKTIPSGYFFEPNAEKVSAVLFSSSGTISKFNRMAGTVLAAPVDNGRTACGGSEAARPASPTEQIPKSPDSVGPGRGGQYSAGADIKFNLTATKVATK